MVFRPRGFIAWIRFSSFDADIFQHEMYHLVNAKPKRPRRGEVPWRPTQRAVVLEPCVVLHPAWRDAVLRVADLYIACSLNSLHTFLDPQWHGAFLFL